MEIKTHDKDGQIPDKDKGFCRNPDTLQHLPKSSTPKRREESKSQGKKRDTWWRGHSISPHILRSCDGISYNIAGTGEIPCSWADRAYLFVRRNITFNPSRKSRGPEVLSCNAFFEHRVFHRIHSNPHIDIISRNKIKKNNAYLFLFPSIFSWHMHIDVVVTPKPMTRNTRVHASIFQNAHTPRSLSRSRMPKTRTRRPHHFFPQFQHILSPLKACNNSILYKYYDQKIFKTGRQAIYRQARSEGKPSSVTINRLQVGSNLRERYNPWKE